MDDENNFTKYKFKEIEDEKNAQPEIDEDGFTTIKNKK